MSAIVLIEWKIRPRSLNFIIKIQKFSNTIMMMMIIIIIIIIINGYGVQFSNLLNVAISVPHEF